MSEKQVCQSFAHTVALFSEARQIGGEKQQQHPKRKKSLQKKDNKTGKKTATGGKQLVTKKKNIARNICKWYFVVVRDVDWKKQK